jgi:hypothetical protein
LNAFGNILQYADIFSTHAISVTTLCRFRRKNKKDKVVAIREARSSHFAKLEGLCSEDSFSGEYNGKDELELERSVYSS